MPACEKCGNHILYVPMWQEEPTPPHICPSCVKAEMRCSRHELKTYSEYFQAIWDGRKCFENRKNDRDFRVGDLLILKEIELSGGNFKSYTGRIIEAEITYLMSDCVFVSDGWVAMSIKVLRKIRES